MKVFVLMCLFVFSSLSFARVLDPREIEGKPTTKQRKTNKSFSSARSATKSATPAAKKAKPAKGKAKKSSTRSIFDYLKFWKWFGKKKGKKVSACKRIDMVHPVTGKRTPVAVSCKGSYLKYAFLMKGSVHTH